jgi:hypothetical protein
VRVFSDIHWVTKGKTDGDSGNLMGIAVTVTPEKKRGITPDEPYEANRHGEEREDGAAPAA